MLWSVTLEAEGDREVTRDEVVELADGVARANGVASGIGSTYYGAQVYVEADDRADAIELATAIFRAAADKAGLPAWELSYAKATSEANELAAEQEDWAVWDERA